VPVALNSGLFWPRRSFRRYPGVVRVEFLPPIEPGLDRQTFYDRLQDAIETKTAELVAMGKRSATAQ
jgi:1-acyl-sn-glycerol-3-phosphate acyltransferase